MINYKRESMQFIILTFLKTYKLVISFFLIIVITNASYAEDVNVPEQINIEDEILVLLGDGVREEYFIDAYHVALYSDAKTLSSLKQNVVNNHLAIRIKVLTDVLPDTPPPYWANIFAETLTEQQYDLFVKNYSLLKANDVLAINYIPDDNSHVYMRKNKILVINSMDFITKILNGFIGAKPVSDDLKNDIMDS